MMNTLKKENNMEEKHEYLILNESKDDMVEIPIELTKEEFETILNFCKLSNEIREGASQPKFEIFTKFERDFKICRPDFKSQIL